MGCSFQSDISPNSLSSAKCSFPSKVQLIYCIWCSFNLVEGSVQWLWKDPVQFSVFFFFCLWLDSKIHLSEINWNLGNVPQIHHGVNCNISLHVTLISYIKTEMYYFSLGYNSKRYFYFIFLFLSLSPLRRFSVKSKNVANGKIKNIALDNSLAFKVKTWLILFINDI